MSADLNDIARKVVEWARDDEQVEVYVSRGTDTDIVVYGGEIESLSRAEVLGAGIRVIKDQRQGFSYAGTLDESVLRETLDEARDNASFATPDEFLGLARPDAVAPPELHLWDDEVFSFPTDQKIEMAMELERLVKAGDRRIRTLRSASYGDGAIEAAIATNTGIDAAYRRTGCYISAYAIAGEGDDTQTGGGYSVGRAPSALDLDKAVRDAVERSTRLLGATKPRSAKLTTIIDNNVTPVLLGVLASALNGESVLKGRSFFADREGQSVAVDNFTLVDDPTNPLAYSAGAYDSEGLACRRNVLIENGVLQGFLYDTYAVVAPARHQTVLPCGLGSRVDQGAGARALALAPGDLNQEEMIKAIGNGLLIQNVTGVHSGVNAISGDFSVGAEGLLIVDGQLGAPVREVTISSTVQKMLQGIVHIGNDVEYLPGSAAGVSLAITDMSMSGE